MSLGRFRRTLGRPPGLRREVAVLVPVSLVLLAALTAFTLFSYRSAIDRLVEERRAEALRLARVGAAQLATSGDDLATELARLRRLSPAVRSLVLVDAAGNAVAASGEAPLGPPLEAFEEEGAAGGGEPRAEPTREGPAGLPAAGATAGPGRRVPGAIAAAVPVALGGRPHVLRLDLEAGTLDTQQRGLPLLTVLVLAVTAGVALLLVLFLRHLMAPYDTLLARAREVDAEAGGEVAGAPGDELAFLLRTFERGVEALAGAGGAGSGRAASGDDDIAALQRTLSASLESGLLLLDPQARLIAVNRVGAELLEVEEPVEGEPVARALAHHPELVALLEEVCREGRPLRRREVTVEGRGGPVPLGLTAHPLRRAPEAAAGDAPDAISAGGVGPAAGAPGEVRGHLVLFADLTEARRRAREARLADNLGRLGELAAGVAHELRNSLATLRGYLALIDRHPDETGAYVAEIRHEADHLQRVLEDFLSFARPGSIRLEEVSLLAVARRAAVDPALEGAAVRVTAAPAVETGAADRLRGDPQLLERAVRNLLRNAVEAQRQAGVRGPVEVLVEAGSGELAAEAGPEAVPGAARGAEAAGPGLVVADRGAGVPEEVADRLFQPFATGRADGVGLGLALAHRIVSLHGGRLHLEPREGGGTRAVMRFPPGNSVTEGNDPQASRSSPWLPEDSASS